MMDPLLKERFARLGPIRTTDRVASGTPAVFVLRLPEAAAAAPRTIDAMFILARHGLTMLNAKRHIETLLDGGVALAVLPTVEDPRAVVDELALAGISAAQVAQSKGSSAQARKT